MTAREVHRVLDALTTAGCSAWLAGGWGVDALAGRQTRPDREVDRLDVAVLQGLSATP